MLKIRIFYVLESCGCFCGSWVRLSLLVIKGTPFCLTPSVQMQNCEINCLLPDVSPPLHLLFRLAPSGGFNPSSVSPATPGPVHLSTSTPVPRASCRRCISSETLPYPGPLGIPRCHGLRTSGRAAVHRRPADRVTTQSDRPAGRVVTQSDRPDDRVVTQCNRPTNCVTTQSDRPTNCVTTQSDRPTGGVVTQSDRPTDRVTTQSDRPVGRVTTQSDRRPTA